MHQAHGDVGLIGTPTGSKFSGPHVLTHCRSLLKNSSLLWWQQQCGVRGGPIAACAATATTSQQCVTFGHAPAATLT